MPQLWFGTTANGLSTSHARNHARFVLVFSPCKFTCSRDWLMDTFRSAVTHKPPEVTMSQSAFGRINRNVTLACRVKSSLEPAIRWFKSGDDAESSRKRQSNDKSLVPISQNFSKISGQVPHFESFLTIEKASNDDRGFYICQASNKANKEKKKKYCLLKLLGKYDVIPAGKICCNNQPITLCSQLYPEGVLPRHGVISFTHGWT